MTNLGIPYPHLYNIFINIHKCKGVHNTPVWFSSPPILSQIISLSLISLPLDYLGQRIGFAIATSVSMILNKTNPLSAQNKQLMIRDVSGCLH
jgi:hypothetical protein